MTQSSLTLVLLVGLPASGKSTFYGERLVESHVLVSKDLIPRSADKKKRQRKLIQAALAEGRSVAVDNVHASRAERAEAIETARPFGVPVVAYRFAEGVAVCRERNVPSVRARPGCPLWRSTRRRSGSRRPCWTRGLTRSTPYVWDRKASSSKDEREEA